MAPTGFGAVLGFERERERVTVTVLGLGLLLSSFQLLYN